MGEVDEAGDAEILPRRHRTAKERRRKAMTLKEAEWCKRWILAQENQHPFETRERLDRHPQCVCDHCRARRLLFPLIEGSAVLPDLVEEEK